MVSTKRCTRCKTRYPATLDYFYKRSVKRGGLDSVCKKCKKQYQYEHQAAYQKQYRQKHKTKYLQYAIQYRKSLRGYLRQVWLDILKRCTNPKAQAYNHYGGRCIKVKFSSFEDFYEYVVNDLKAEPRGLTIDRIDNDGHYEKGNIRFVSQSENNRNQRKKVFNSERKYHARNPRNPRNPSSRSKSADPDS